MNAKIIAPLSAVLLAACAAGGGSSAPTGATAPSPARPGGEQICDAAPVANLVGQAWSERMASTAQQRSGAGILRVLKPGQVMTLEYNPRRLTIVLDDAHKVSSARCG